MLCPALIQHLVLVDNMHLKVDKKNLGNSNDNKRSIIIWKKKNLKVGKSSYLHTHRTESTSAEKPHFINRSNDLLLRKNK